MPMHQTLSPVHALLFICLFFTETGAMAQDIIFSANIGGQKVGLKDHLQVTYTIDNAPDLESLEPAPSKDFTIVGGPMDARSNSLSVSNGRRIQKSSFSRTFILQPKRTGKLTVPAGIARTTDGRTFRSNAPGVEVVKGTVAPSRQSAPTRDPVFDQFFSDPIFQSPFSAPPPPAKKVWAPQPGRDLFIRASVSKPTAYVGEAVVVSYHLFSRVTVQAALTDAPQASGVWTEEVPTTTPKPTDEIVNGRPYRAVLLKQLLVYPQQPGKITLPPAEVEGFAQAPGDVFASTDPFFDAASLDRVPLQLHSGPVNLTVLPLPDTDRPDNFSGAVGDNLSFKASLDRQETTTNEGATLTLVLRGRGAGRLVKLPRPVFPPGVDAYEPVVTDSVLADGTALKTVRYSLAVRKAGTYNFQPVAFSFFNTSSGQYETIAGSPLQLQVAAGNDVVSMAAASTRGNNGESGLVSKGLLALFLAGGVGMAAYFLMRSRSAQQPRPVPITSTGVQVPSFSVAEPAGISSDLEKAATHAEILRLFRQQLAHTLGVSSASLTKGETLRALDARGIPESVQETVHQVWQQCEAALYAPGAEEENVEETAHAAALALDKIRLKLAA
jgi:hypothetical protein